jgi:hypothetical protein
VFYITTVTDSTCSISPLSRIVLFYIATITDSTCSISSSSRMIKTTAIRRLHQHSHCSSHGPHTPLPLGSLLRLFIVVSFFSSSARCLILNFVGRAKSLLSKGKQTNKQTNTWSAWTVIYALGIQRAASQLCSAPSVLCCPVASAQTARRQIKKLCKLTGGNKGVKRSIGLRGSLSLQRQ